MKIEQIEKNASFLFYCKDAYFKKIRPANAESKSSDEYKNLVKIAQLYFDNNLEERFGTYLKEGHYLIQVWTAHLILEYGNTNDSLRQQCIEEIFNNTDNPFAREIEYEERLWLKKFKVLKK